MKLGFVARRLVTWVLFACLYSNIRGDVLDNWKTNQISTNSFCLNHFVYGSGIYVAVGESGDSAGYYTSPDGMHWKLQHTESSSWGANLNYAGGHFTSVRSSYSWASIANVSSDGTNWSTTFFGTPAIDPLAATYGNNLYVVVGSTNNVACIVTSPDGVTWTSRKASSSPGGPISSVAYGNGKFVAIGNNDGLEYTSSTGIGGINGWSQSSIPGGNKISFANGLFFVPFNAKTNLLSTDGINWSQRATGLTNMLGVVNYSHGVFIAQCGISRSGSYLATSLDGTNWFQYPKILPNFCPVGDTSDFDSSVATDGFHFVTGSGVVQNSGYSYNGYVYVSDPLVSVQQTNNLPMNITLSGLVGRNYQIQSSDVLGSGSLWVTNITIRLTNTSYVWTNTSTTNAAKFFRGVLLP